MPQFAVVDMERRAQHRRLGPSAVGTTADEILR
jgi:hypothetical protein